MNVSVMQMVHQVLDDAKKKTADVSSGVKTAAARVSPRAPTTGGSSDLSTEYLGKLADACDFLAENIHSINDNRSPQQKLAEYAAISQNLTKKAFEVGNAGPKEPTLDGYQSEGNEGEHQHKEAPEAYQSPKTPSLDSGAPNPGGSNSAIEATPAMTTGEAPDVGDLGEGTAAHQSPKSVVPNEKPTPTSASNALETNKDMMMANQPEEVLKQARAERILAKVGGQDKVALQKQASALKQARVLLIKAAQAGVPQDVAMGIIGLSKLGEDALYPAQISAGTEPELQREPGVPSQMSQGSEAGSNTPRESAPNAGEGGGRELLSSNEAAINATKDQAKRQGKGPLAELLSEPAMSQSTDKALEVALDNTSSAGVKISAMRELIKKYASTSKGNAKKVVALAKLADGEIPPGPPAPMPQAPVPPAPVPQTPPPPMAGPEGAPEGAPPMDPAIMEAALAAAQAGVTPEELVQAHELLEANAGPQGEAAQPGEVPAAGAVPPPKSGTGGNAADFGLSGGSAGAGGM